MGSGPSAAAKGPDPNIPAAAAPAKPPAATPASVAAAANVPAASKPSPAAVPLSQQQVIDPGNPSSAQKPGSQTSSREVEQAAAGKAWGASHKE